MNKVAGIIMLVILVIGSIPLIGLATQIEWTFYLSIPLILLMGSAGVAFLTKRIEVLIGGVVITALLSALLPVVLPLFIESFKSALSYIF